MARHTFEVVGHHLAPIETRIIVLDRSRDLVDDAGARRGEKTFQRQRLDAFDHDAAHHLDGGRRTDLAAGDADSHAERAHHRGNRGRVRACEQHRRLMARRMDRRQHRDIDIARRVAKELCGFLLAAGRDRIDVEEERLLREVRLDRLGRIDARCRRHRRNNRVRAAHRIGRRGGATHADRRSGVLLVFRRPGPGKECPRRRSVSMPASRRPDAMASPASPKPMKDIVGLPVAMGLFLIRHYGFFRRVRWEMTLSALCRNAAMPAARLHRRRRPIGCVSKI